MKAEGQLLRAPMLGPEQHIPVNTDEHPQDQLREKERDAVLDAIVARRAPAGAHGGPSALGWENDKDQPPLISGNLTHAS